MNESSPRHPGSGFAPLCFLATVSTLAWFDTEQARAQPSPSFSATCETVRAEADRLDSSSDELITIEVTGELLLAESDGVLSYMGMCAAPAPRVLCVTYTLDGHKTGDRVTVAGHYQRSDADFITLDPCLHHPPVELR